MLKKNILLENGASAEPCKESYRGLSAFSEVEVKSVANYLEKLSKSVTLKAYWNLHAYSQLFLTPWSYSTNDTSDQLEFVGILNVKKKNKSMIQSSTECL